MTKRRIAPSSNRQQKQSKLQYDLLENRCLLAGLFTQPELIVDSIDPIGNTERLAISADGRFVAFSSERSDLVSGDTNGSKDVFLQDTTLGTVTLVSASSAGILGNGDSERPSISADGRYVSFESVATNLGANSSSKQIYVKDTQTGTVILASPADGSTTDGANGSNSWATLSGDGRFVVFTSESTNLVASDQNSFADIFVRDTLLNTTEIASLKSDGSQTTRDSFLPDISADGNFVVFSTNEPLLPIDTRINSSDVYRKDLTTGELALVSTDVNNTASNSNAHIELSDLHSSISQNGRWIAFETVASNLVPGDTNREVDIFVKDMTTGELVRASVATDGSQANKDSYFPSISDDGQRVSFTSLATNLSPFVDNGFEDVFVRDLTTSETVSVSSSLLGVLANNRSRRNSISPDGDSVAFLSRSDSLSQDKSTNDWAVFKSTISDQISPNAPVITIGNGDSDNATFIATGNGLVASGTLSVEDPDTSETIHAVIVNVSWNGNPGFHPRSTLASMLTIDNPVIDASSTSGKINWQFNSSTAPLDHLAVGETLQLRYAILAGDQLGGEALHEVTISITGTKEQTHVIQRVNLTETGEQFPGDSRLRGISTSRDGNLVVYSIKPSADGNRIYLRDISTQTVTQIDVPIDGLSGSWQSESPDISEAGRYVVFASSSERLVVGDSNFSDDIFRKDLLTGETQIVSISEAGVQSDNDARNPVISADGRYVVYTSDDIFDLGHVTLYVKDMVTGILEQVSVDSNEQAGNRGGSSPTISDDGRYIAFSSSSDNLVPGDTNGKADIFLRDRVLGTTSLASKTQLGGFSNGISTSPSISGDGRFIAYVSYATDLVSIDNNGIIGDVFLYDGLLGRTTLLNYGPDNVGGDGHASSALINNDGSIIAFTSGATNLVAGGADFVASNVFTFDVKTSNITQVNVSATGDRANANTSGIAFSGDGGSVVFSTTANNLVANDTNGERTVGDGNDFFHVSLADQFNLRELGSGVAANDNATGTGFLLYSLQDVQDRFDNIEEENAAKLIAVRQNGDQWQYTHREGEIVWIDFTPVESDRLIAEIDFDADTIEGLIGFDSFVGGVKAGYATGDLTFTPNSWNSTFNVGEFQVSGSQFTIGSQLPIGELGMGIAANDNATGTGFLLYSSETVQSRFTGIYSSNASHFVAVRHNGGQWQFTQREGVGWSNFTPVSSDRLVAQIDFDADTIEGLRNINAEFAGIKAGFLESDLLFFANRWNGTGNTGEFEIEGTYFDSAPLLGQATSTLLGDLRSGVAADDNATGTGYILFSQQPVQTRFTGIYAVNSTHLVAVRQNGNQWQFTQREATGWVDFTPVSSDRLIAEVDFDADTISNLQGINTTIGGIDAGYATGDLIFQANRFGGVGNTGEFVVSGKYFDSDVTNSVVTTTAGNTGFGVAADDMATGSGFLLYTDESVHTRFSNVFTDNADHFIAVRFEQDQWQFTNKEAFGWVDFTPRESDRLVASIDFDLDTVTGLLGIYTTVQGIEAGYNESDLTVAANVWNGTANDGEFGVSGSYFKVGPIIKRTNVGNLGLGVSASDDATGTGYLLYSAQMVQERLAHVYNSSANHLIAVRLDDNQWQYTNVESGIGWKNFTPVATDRIIAEIDFDLDTIDAMLGIDTVIEGVDAGYIAGDLNFVADRWNGQPNDGEFEVTGTFFEIA
jgi:VCBS repeat-containing protein